MKMLPGRQRLSLKQEFLLALVPTATVLNVMLVVLQRGILWILRLVSNSRENSR